MLCSMALALEIPMYLRWSGLIRYTSLAIAIIYNFWYLLFLWLWALELFELDPEQVERLGTFDILMNIFFIYNAIMHCGIVVTNFFIIFKEFELEFYELEAYEGTTREALSWNLAREAFWEDVWFLDPFRVFDRLFYAFAGWHPLDFIYWNPEDPDNYMWAYALGTEGDGNNYRPT
jgi:hypothetical protein